MENYQTRLRRLEESISILEYQQDSCRPFIKLAEDSETLGTINAQFGSYLSQLAELEKEYGLYQQAVEDLGVRMENARSTHESTIAIEIQRKEELLEKLDQRLVQIESNFRSIAEDNPIDMQAIEDKLKLDVEEMVQEARQRIQLEKSQFQETVTKANKASANYATETQKSFKGTGDELEEFEIKYHEFIKNPNDPQGDKMNIILTQAKAHIGEYIDACKLEMDGKFRTLRTKFTFEMDQMKEQLETMEASLKGEK